MSAGSPIMQHTVNAAVAAAPVATIWAHAPEIVTTGVGVMAFLYYLLFFIEKFQAWRRTWRKVTTTTVTKTETITPPKAP